MERGKVKREKGKEPEKEKIQQKGEERNKKKVEKEKIKEKEKGKEEKIKEKNGKKKTGKGKEEKIKEKNGKENTGKGEEEKIKAEERGKEEKIKEKENGKEEKSKRNEDEKRQEQERGTEKEKEQFKEKEKDNSTLIKIPLESLVRDRWLGPSPEAIVQCFAGSVTCETPGGLAPEGIRSRLPALYPRMESECAKLRTTHREPLLLSRSPTHP